MKVKSLKKVLAFLLVLVMAFTWSTHYRRVYADSEPGLSSEGDVNGGENSNTDTNTDTDTDTDTNTDTNTDTMDNSENAGESSDPSNPKDTNDQDGPKDPNNPNDQDNPNDPNDPNDQDNPDDPNDQDNPDDPNDPNDQDNPDDPNDQDNPDDPDDPNDPDDPDDPNDPNDQDNPDDPNDPNDPEEPNGPEDPDNPNDPNDANPPEDLKEPDTTESADYNELLRGLLYSIETTFGSEHIEWVLKTFAYDLEFLESLYYTILDDPNYAQLFLEETYELYRSDSSEIMYQSMDLPRLMNASYSAAKGLVGESESVNDSYIQNFRKTIAQSGFRHYDVELSLVGEPALVLQSSADVMLIIDVGLGKSQYETLTNAAKAFARKMYGVTDTASESRANGSRIGFIAYDGKGIRAGHEIAPVNTYKEFVTALDRTEHGSNSDPNIQEYIIRAKYALGIMDGQVNTGGQKAIIFLTANDKVSSQYSDTWAGSGANSSVSIPIQSGSVPSKGYKRWSYLGSTNVRYFCGPSRQLLTDNTVWTLNHLEGQYTVAQGVDIYAIGFGKVANLLTDLKQMTWKMTNPPQKLWDGNKYYDYAPNRGVDSSIGTDRARIGDENSIIAIYEEIAEAIIKEMAGSVQVTDTLEKEFEVLREGKPIPQDDLAAGPVAIGGNVTVTLDQNGNQKIIWNADQISASTGNPTAINYEIRVKDERIWPKGRGLNQNDDGSKTAAGSETHVIYKANEAMHDLSMPKQPLVTVDPLIAGAAWAADENGNHAEAVLAGDNAVLTGRITSGNGSYSYQWYKGDAGKWTAIDTYSVTDMKDDAGNNLNIILNAYDIPDRAEGSYEYLLAITDNAARDAGYKNTSVILLQGSSQESVIQANYMCKLQIFEPVLRINVVDGNNSTGIAGLFETRVERSGSKDDGYWYFAGLDKKTYGAADVIIRGTYSAETYVPYGYQVSKKNPQSVEITLKKECGVWTGYTGEMTIIVSETDPWYFYDWAWPTKRNETAFLPNTAAMIIPAPIIFLIGKRKRWFK